MDWCGLGLQGLLWVRVAGSGWFWWGVLVIWFVVLWRLVGVCVLGWGVVADCVVLDGLMLVVW